MKHVIVIETPDHHDTVESVHSKKFQSECIRAIELVSTYYFNDAHLIRSEFFQDSAVQTVQRMYNYDPSYQTQTPQR